jgi:hypothetical protein
MKQQRRQKEQSKEKRSVMRESLQNNVTGAVDEERADTDKLSSAANTATFEDESTVNMFGSSVSVVIDESPALFGKEDQDGSLDVQKFVKTSKTEKREKTKFEKAIKKAKIIMASRPKHKRKLADGVVPERNGKASFKKGKNSRRQKSAKKAEVSTALFRKALGKR